MGPRCKVSGAERVGVNGEGETGQGGKALGCSWRAAGNVCQQRAPAGLRPLHRHNLKGA